MTLRETYARDICQNPGVPLEDCPRRDEHYALVDERLAGLAEELARVLANADLPLMFADESYPVESDWADFAAAIVAALEDRT